VVVRLVQVVFDRVGTFSDLVETPLDGVDVVLDVVYVLVDYVDVVGVCVGLLPESRHVLFHRGDLGPEASDHLLCGPRFVQEVLQGVGVGGHSLDPVLQTVDPGGSRGGYAQLEFLAERPLVFLLDLATTQLLDQSGGDAVAVGRRDGGDSRGCVAGTGPVVGGVRPGTGLDHAVPSNPIRRRRSVVGGVRPGTGLDLRLGFRTHGSSRFTGVVCWPFVRSGV